MTDVAHDLYLFVAVLGLLPAVRLLGLPVLAGSAFVAVGGVGALRLEEAGLPIGGAMLLAIVLGAIAGAATGTLVARAEPAFVALCSWALAWLAPLTFPGGAEGLTRPAFDTVETPFGATFELTPTIHVAAALALSALAYAGVKRLASGPTGSDALALRDDPELAAELRVGALPRKALLLAVAGAAAATAGAGIAVLLGVAASADASPLLALQLLAAALAATRQPLLGLVVIVALHRAPDLLTPVLLLAGVALQRAPRPIVDDAEPVSPPPLEPAAGGFAVRALHAERGGRTILRGLDLEVAGGEIHALIGPNGSGKTTALRELDVTRTFQRDALLPSLTPYRQVLVALRATHHDERAWTYLDLVGVPPHATELTSGEERLLGVARAAATGAPNLAFDEPAVGMSAGERERLVSALRALAESGRAILVVEHDLRLVASVADTVTVLGDGRAAAHGTPDEVIDALRKVYA